MVLSTDEQAAGVQDERNAGREGGVISAQVRPGDQSILNRGLVGY